MDDKISNLTRRIEWLDSIPLGWGIMPLKYTAIGKECCFIDGDWIESKDIDSAGIKYLTTGNVGPNKYKEQGFGYISENTFKRLGCTEVFPGDLLISRLNEPIARTCIVPDLNSRIVTAVDNVIYRPNLDLVDKRYICYFLNSEGLTEHANIIARGATMHRISRTMLGHLKVLIPPMSVQKSIADFLDIKCEKIDSAIETQQKRIGLLKELRQNIITMAVSNGIHKDVGFVFSGDESIGNIPKHWKTIKLKFVCDIHGRVGFKGYTVDDLVPEGEGAYTIGGKHITNNVIDLSDPEFIRWEKYYESPEIMVKKGDIITAQRGTLGRTALVNEDIGPATINPSLVLLNNIRISNDFLYWCLVSNIVLTDIELLNTSTAVPMVSQAQIKNIRIPLPPIEEQLEIVAHIETERQKIDDAIDGTMKKLDLLNQYKQSIITEVITGKKKVI